MTLLLAALPLLALLSAAVVRALIARPILDAPDARKAHPRPTPTAGGLGVLCALAAGVALLAAAGDPGLGEALPLLAGSFALGLVGLLDDRWHLPPLPRLMAQLAAAGAVIGAGIVPEPLALPGVGEVVLGAAGAAVALLWLLAATNAANFLDGSDGLLGGSLLIAALMLALCAAVAGVPVVAALCLCLAAGLAGFLPFNWPPARIFLGDTGSQAAGFLLAGLALLLAEATGGVAVLAGPLLLAAHLFDAGFTLLRRALAGQALLRPHRTHLYQMAAQAGWAADRLARLHAGFALWHGLLALALLLVPPLWPAALLLALAGQVLWLAVVLRAMRRAGLSFTASD